MYFKKLEIFGFKSFADKTFLNFEPGITAIVGPNGCGKSNVFDSIRWVLGEQSVKELRGSSMEDVIFNGTDKKPGLGFAEVSLTFSNESRKLPLEYDEITVSRRLFRSGESEYLLNKSVVRLKDIVELFMGTGIGAEAYSLVQQGKVDLVVSARPEDRRVIFDEAAGITKYKSKKREALNKLKDTENNLLRINDIVLEVKRQIGSIERQANKARKYKEEIEKLKVYEIHLARWQMNAFIEQKETIARLLQEFKVKETKLQSEIVELKNIVEYENETLGELEDKINQVIAEDLKLENAIELNSRQIAFNEERLENLAAQETRLTEQHNQTEERCRQQEAKIADLNQTLITLEQTVIQTQQTLQSKKETLQSLLQAIQQDKDSIRSDEEKIMALTSRQVKIKNELTEIMKESQTALGRKRRLETENDKVSSEKIEIDQRLVLIAQDINQSSTETTRLKETKAAEEQLLTNLQGELMRLEIEVDEAEKKKVFLLSQKAFIEELRVHYQDMPDPVVEGRLLTHSLPQEKHGGIIGKVKEVLPIDLEKYPHLKEQAANGTNFYEIICETKFVELDPVAIGVKIEESDEKISYLNGLKEAKRQSISEQNSKIERIQTEILSQEKNLSIFEAQRNDIEVSSSKLSGELELVSIEIREIHETLAQLKHKEDGLSHALSQSNRELQFCQQGIQEKQQKIVFKSQEREEVSVALVQLETEINSLADKQKDQKDNVRLFTETLEVGRREIEGIKTQAAQQLVQKEKFEKEITDLNAKIDSLRFQKDSLKNILVEHEKQKQEISSRLNGVRQNIFSMEREIEAMKTQTHEQQMLEQQMVFNQNGIKDRLLQLYRINWDEVTGAHKPVETEAVSPSVAEPLAEGEAANSDVIPSAASAPVQAPIINAELLAATANLSAEELNAEIEKLRKKCEAYGSVNLVAIEEYEELRQRFEFLTKQQSDLLTAKESLHQTILKINRTTRQMFVETFERVAEEFRTYYRMLFGGGEAQLVLLDPENVLESGIDIIARPPGKKLQNISLLSGGEKTLTAIALIFGVFKVRPSPFCVLDEIDAALDESNVGRFGELLKEFAKIAQFIVITHNKKTINNADVMYGITMQETGVSKVVSVKLSENKQQEISQPQNEPETVAA